MTIAIRPLDESDLPEAERIFRLAFGTQLRLPDPMTAFGDADYIYSRWKANRGNAYAAELDGRLVGSNFTACWGTVGFFGPLTVDPAAWGKGIGKLLIEAAVAQFDRWQLTHRGLFTFSDSVKHVSLYGRYGFWPRFLTGITSRSVSRVQNPPRYKLWSELDSQAKRQYTTHCLSVTNALYPGLNVSSEIETVERLSLGDSLLIEEDDRLSGFAVCHCGPRTEAGSGACYVKFAAIRPSESMLDAFVRLVAACEHFAIRRGCQRVVCGINYGRIEAVKCLARLGYKTEMLGVTMHFENSSEYSHPAQLVIDDWR